MTRTDLILLITLLCVSASISIAMMVWGVL